MVVPSPHQAECRQMLQYFPACMIYWKDIEKNYFIGCNDKTAKFLGLNHPDDIIGSDGYDYFNDETVEIFRVHEEKVKQTLQPVIITNKIYSDQLETYTSVDAIMAPIFNSENKLQSIICYGNIIMTLSDKPWASALQLINKENISKLICKKRYTINFKQNKIQLSKREVESSLFFLKGLSAKQMAREMGITARTIEFHLDNIKAKFGCLSRSDLLDNLLHSNFIDNF